MSKKHDDKNQVRKDRDILEDYRKLKREGKFKSTYIMERLAYKYYLTEAACYVAISRAEEREAKDKEEAERKAAEAQKQQSLF